MRWYEWEKNMKKMKQNQTKNNGPGKLKELCTM